MAISRATSVARAAGRVSDGTRTRDRLDHNQELYLLSYAHHVAALSGDVRNLAAGSAYAAGEAVLTALAAISAWNATTTAGSNCVPAHLASSSRAASTVKEAP